MRLILRISLAKNYKPIEIHRQHHKVSGNGVISKGGVKQRWIIVKYSRTPPTFKRTGMTLEQHDCLGATRRLFRYGYGSRRPLGHSWSWSRARKFRPCLASSKARSLIGGLDHGHSVSDVQFVVAHVRFPREQANLRPINVRPPKGNADANGVQSYTEPGTFEISLRPRAFLKKIVTSVILFLYENWLTKYGQNKLNRF